MIREYTSATQSPWVPVGKPLGPCLGKEELDAAV